MIDFPWTEASRVFALIEEPERMESVDGVVRGWRADGTLLFEDDGAGRWMIFWPNGKPRIEATPTNVVRLHKLSRHTDARAWTGYYDDGVVAGTGVIQDEVMLSFVLRDRKGGEWAVRQAGGQTSVKRLAVDEPYSMEDAFADAQRRLVAELVAKCGLDWGRYYDVTTQDVGLSEDGTTHTFNLVATPKPDVVAWLKRVGEVGLPEAGPAPWEIGNPED